MGCVQSTDKVEGTVASSVPPGATTVFGDEFVVPPGKPMILYLKAKFFTFSGADFKVVDVNNNNAVVMMVNGEVSFNNKKTICDPAGKPLFEITEKVMQLNDKQTVKNLKTGEEIFKVASNIGNTKQYTEGLKNKSGQDIKLSGKMHLTDKKGTMWLGEVGTGTCIAKVCSPVDLQSVIPDWGGVNMAEHSYFMEIAPGVDAALVVAMTLAYDEMEATYDTGI